MAALAAVAIAGIGLAKSSKEASKARSAQRRQGAAEKAIAMLENARTRRRQIREARVQRGTTFAQGATQGGGGGFGTLAASGTQGKARGVVSQLESNLEFLDESSRLSSIASDEGIAAANAQSRANTAAGFASAALAVGSIYAPAPSGESG